MTMSANPTPGPDPMEVAAQWCTLLAEDDMSEAEWQAFGEWYEQSGNRALLRQSVAVWQLCDEIADWPDVIHLRSQALSEYRDGNRYRWTPSRARPWKWAVGLAMVVGLIVSCIFFLARPQYEMLDTGTGERQVAELADNSKVSLDASTSVAVLLDDTERDLVLQQGRAKFDVAHDPQRPFRVHVGNKTVVAIGTSF
ncbi:MAG: FecR family protein, partial [Sphingomonadaceae bacterium]